MSYEDLDITLEREPYFAELSYVSLDGKTVVVAYAVRDEEPCSASNPLQDCDAMGMIVTGREKWEHVGRDDNGGPFWEDQMNIVMRLMGFQAHDFDELDGEDAERVELAAVAMWEGQAAKGEVGTKWAVGLRDYGRGGEYYQITGTENIDAVWVPDKYWLEHINSIPEAERAERAASDIKNILDEYNKWATGEVYGICVETFKLDEDGNYQQTDSDSCWGFIGDDYAKESVQEYLDNAVASATGPQLCLAL